MKITIRALGVVFASMVCAAAVLPALAAEPAGTQYLAVTQDDPASRPGVVLGPMSKTGQDVTLTLPGVWRMPVKGRDGGDYAQLALPGYGVTAQAVGQPAMPFKGFFLEVPHGVDVSAVVRGRTAVSLGVGHVIHPLQPPEPDDQDDPPAFAKDAEAYATDGWFPPEPVVLGEPGIIRGRRVVFVQVFPLQYNPATTELRAFSSLTFRLTYDGVADRAGSARKARLATAESEAIAREFVLNYTPADADEAGDLPALPLDAPDQEGGEPDLAEGDGADYLIIAGDGLDDEVLPLAEWKHRKGLLTRLVTMSEVGSTAEDVKAYIQNAYDTWTPAPSYVLLVGDVGNVPPDYDYGMLECYTDQPYSCVDGADYYPDLTLGRLSVQTGTECQAVVDKILTYDRTPDTGDWYDAFLSAGYFQDDDNDAIADRWFMETTIHIAEFLEGTVGLTRYSALCTNSGTHAEYHYRGLSYPHRFSYPDPVPSSVTSLWTSDSQAQADISAAINAGVGLVIHRDHGSQTGWGDPPYHNAEVNALSNGVKTPVVFSINCQSGSYHRTNGDCFCEAFLKKTSGGAVGIVGATRNSYSGWNDLLAHGMITCFWPSHDPSHTEATYPHSWRPAAALTYGKYYMMTYKGTGPYAQGEFNMFQWFGDPEIMLRTRTPETLAVSYPNSVSFAVPVDLTVTVEMDGAPLEGARVGISHPDTDEHWSGLTDPNGALTFSGISFGLKDDYDVVVTARDATPYEGTIAAVPSSTGSIHLDRETYSCAGTIGIQITDADLEGAGTQDVSVATEGGDAEMVTLTETDPNSGVFTGTIATGPAPVTTDNDVVELTDGETITAAYEDANDGTGHTAVVEDTAVADCVPPVISNVQVVEVVGTRVTVLFETDTPTTGRVRCGLACGGPYPWDGEDASLSTSHTVEVAGLSPQTPYVFVVDAWDDALNEATDDNGGTCYAFVTPVQPDYFTEYFDSGDNDLAYRSVTFTPDGADDHYAACQDAASVFPTDPNGGTVLNLDDDASILLVLQGGAQIQLYGLPASGFYLGSNGYITAPYTDSNPTPSLEDHFNMVRVSTLFADLDPSAGGTVSWKQLADRVAITFQAVPECGVSNSNSFQTELFFDGVIRLTWLGIDATNGLVGLSEGQGVPGDFVESDMTAYGSCTPHYSLAVSVINDLMGHIEFDPEPNDLGLPEYAQGTEVTLTAVVDYEQRRFSHWEIYDPNFPDDANYMVTDSNAVLTVMMDGDREVTAVFACGSTGGEFVASITMMLTALMLVRRRR